STSPRAPASRSRVANARRRAAWIGAGKGVTATPVAGGMPMGRWQPQMADGRWEVESWPPGVPTCGRCASDYVDAPASTLALALGARQSAGTAPPLRQSARFRAAASRGRMPTHARDDMAIQQLTEEQVKTWSRAQKDEWWLNNVYRGDMAQLTWRS